MILLQRNHCLFILDKESFLLTKMKSTVAMEVNSAPGCEDAAAGYPKWKASDFYAPHISLQTQKSMLL